MQLRLGVREMGRPPAKATPPDAHPVEVISPELTAWTKGGPSPHGAPAAKAPPPDLTVGPPVKNPPSVLLNPRFPRAVPRPENLSRAVAPPVTVQLA